MVCDVWYMVCENVYGVWCMMWCVVFCGVVQCMIVYVWLWCVVLMWSIVCGN